MKNKQLNKAGGRWSPSAVEARQVVAERSRGEAGGFADQPHLSESHLKKWGIQTQATSGRSTRQKTLFLLPLLFKITDRAMATREEVLMPMRLGDWVRKIAILGCLLLLVSCQGKNQLPKNEAQVKVARVVSGQSLEVLGMAEQPNLISQVRLVGIDAPDLRQRPWGEAAKEQLENLIGGAEQSVTLEFDLETKDKIGRTLAYVWKNKVLLNEELVKQGNAMFVGRSPNHKYDQRLERAQQWARLMGQGIWNPEKPMHLTPAEFRRQNL